MRKLTPKDYLEWLSALERNADGGAILQSNMFGETKALGGWTPRYYEYSFNKKPLKVMFLVKRLPIFGEFWYCPNGPGATDLKTLQAFLKETRMSNDLKNAFVLRLEPRIKVRKLDGSEVVGLNHIDVSEIGLVLSTKAIQTNFSTVIVGLSDSEELLNSFSSKLRYGIRYAERKGVEVIREDFSEEGARRLYDLMKTTSKRSSYALRSIEYYKAFWQKFNQAGAGEFYFAKFQNKVLAGAFFARVGKNSVYKDGGSLRDYAELNAPSLMLYRAMVNQYEAGCTTCDLHGAAPIDSVLTKEAHPLSGITRFKCSFNNQVTEYMPSSDLVLKPGLYKLWAKFGEKLFMRLSFRIRGEIFY